MIFLLLYLNNLKQNTKVMKTIFIPLSITAMIISLLFASCGTSKKMQASTTPSTKVKKQEAIVPKTESIATPPGDIKNNFSTRFPSAENATWKRQSILTNEASASTSYNVSFVEAGKKIWITYSEKGTIIEERQEILIDQLPQNIYNAIRTNYPTYKVASATTYKSTEKEGSYAVVLSPLSKFDTKEIEVILTENASLVE